MLDNFSVETAITKLIIQIVIFIGFIAAILLVFDLEAGLAIVALVGLITAQVFFLAQRTRIKKKSGSILKGKPIEELLKGLDQTKEKPKAESGVETHIDPSIFSKFEKNLTRSEKAVEAHPSTPRDDEKEVVLSISSQGKKAGDGKKKKLELKTKPSSKRASDSSRSIKTGRKSPAISQDSDKDVEKLTGKVPTTPLGSIFDDVQEPLESTPVKRKTGDTPPKDTESALSAEQSLDDMPLASHEMLTSEDLEPDDQDAKNEAELVLAMAEKEFDEQKYEEALATIRQILDTPVKDLSDPTNIRNLVELKGECEFALKQYDLASKTWQELFKKHIKKDQPEFLPLLEKVIQKYVGEQQQEYAVHFLFTALNEYRQARRFAEMDYLYQEVENAYRQMEDWPRLIQTCQNHLAIKKALKDYPGQLELLDHLGKLLYDQDDTEGSKKCYEQRLAIESKISKS